MSQPLRHSSASPPPWCSPAAPGILEPIVRLWLLRLLVPLGGARELLHSDGFRDADLARAAGLRAWAEPGGRRYQRERVFEALGQAHQRAELELRGAQLPGGLRGNVRRLGQLVGLDAPSRRILEFVVLLHGEQVLESACDLLGALSMKRLDQVLATLLALPPGQVRAALAPQAALVRSGLLFLDRQGSARLRARLDLPSSTFADLAQGEEGDPVGLLRGTVAPAGPGQLELQDYAHLHALLAVLVPYLRRALAERRPGVNFYLHGAPGTGKSQLARALARELGAELFEVASEDTDGEPIRGHRRLRAYRMAQSVLGQRGALLLFDEVEDIFSGEEPGWLARRNGNDGRPPKAWLNRMLEGNPVPTLWVSNSTGGVDAAHVRRFDMVLELPVPPRSQRERIVRAHCAGLLDTAAQARLAASEHLAPAVIARASSVVQAVAAGLTPAQRAHALEGLVNGTLRAQGHAALATCPASQGGAHHDLAFVCADTDLAQLAQGLASAASARLCLYGPPGTGKTAYARWLAHALDRPLHARRASELMHKYVGDSEKAIARAFTEAAQEGALLLIDEVDSFLQDRRAAQRSWEVAQVNEMLTQMEAFEGLFVASTNLMRGLDTAALRRFDLKVKFDWLRPDQAWALLQHHCARLALPLPERLRPQLARLGTLAPGDFAAVVRQHSFRPLGSADVLVALLQAECALKEDGMRTGMGFL
ncbi:ATP-binding protein [Melaminivora sp.]|uniref:AAA family ATPase n=1 Tax=Melaminivora sp. TaxID=1933032 RepID=UPI0028A5DE08|nr:ATP-binding protein [Melaminivora sp.]